MSLLLHDGRIMSHCVLSEAQLKEMMENEAGSVASVAPMIGLGAGVAFCCPAEGRVAFDRLVFDGF